MSIMSSAQPAAPATAADDPEIGRSIRAAGILTNYHDLGEGFPALFIHGSGPGVSAWANWRLVLAPLAQRMRVIAPDMAGFGFTERRAEIVRQRRHADLAREAGAAFDQQSVHARLTSRVRRGLLPTARA